MSDKTPEFNFQRFLDQFESKLEETAIQYKDTLWKHYLGQNASQLPVIEKELTGIMMNPELRVFLSDEIVKPHDEITQRQIQLILTEIQKMLIDSNPEHNHAVRSIRDYLSDWMIRLGKKDYTFYQVQQLLLMQSETEKRKIIYQSLEPGLESLDEPWNDLIGIRNRLAHDYGFGNYISFMLSVLEISDELLKQIRELSETQRSRIRKEKKLYKDLFPAEPWDIQYRFLEQNQQLNQFPFPPEKTQWSILEFIKSLNISPDDLLLQTIDAGPDFPSLCIPVSVPDDIRMFLCTGESWEQYQHTVSEYGRACHYGLVRENRYILKSVNPVLLNITAELFYQFMTDEQIIRVICEDEKELSVWMTRKRIRDDAQMLLFSALAEFEMKLYTHSIRDLQGEWENISKTFFGLTGGIIPDWKIQEWFISRPFKALEMAVSGFYSRLIYDKIKDWPLADTGALLTQTVFESGSRVPWYRNLPLMTG